MRPRVSPLARRLLPLGALALATVAAAAETRGPRFDSPVGGFEVPRGYRPSPGSDALAELAVRLELERPEEGRPTGAQLAVGGRRIQDGELDSEAGAWHAAHLKNRVAWGMRSEGGLPRDSFHHAGRRYVRFRDRVGSVMGAVEQTLICAIVEGRLACASVSAAASTREEADLLALALLGSLSLTPAPAAVEPPPPPATSAPPPAPPPAPPRPARKQRR